MLSDLGLQKEDEVKLLPRVRRLWAKAYAATNTVMSAELTPQAPTEKVHLTGADRADQRPPLLAKPSAGCGGTETSSAAAAAGPWLVSRSPGEQAKLGW